MRLLKAFPGAEFYNRKHRRALQLFLYLWAIPRPRVSSRWELTISKRETELVPSRVTRIWRQPLLLVAAPQSVVNKNNYLLNVVNIFSVRIALCSHFYSRFYDNTRGFRGRRRGFPRLSWARAAFLLLQKIILPLTTAAAEIVQNLNRR